MASPKKKFKTFNYQTSVTWLGGRAGDLASDGKPSFRVASPPEFKGEEGVWSPEDLFVASVNVCVLTTFIAFAEHKKLDLESYRSSAEGLLERAENGYEFTKITVSPIIRVSREDDIAQAEELLHRSHEKCLISNSIKGRVALQADIDVA